MKHPYLMDLNNQENWLYSIELFGANGHKGEDQRTIHMPEGSDRLFCVTDSLMYPAAPDAPVDYHYHEHKYGWEDFFVDSGGLDLYVNGKKAYVAPGDIIHLQPYEAHGMNFHAPTKYRGFMHGIANSDNAPVFAVLREKNPDAANDPDLPRNKILGGDFHPREAPVLKEIAPEMCSSIRNISRPLETFELDGITMKMIVARWENGGLCEMWAAEMKEGFKAESIKYPLHLEMYYVTSGQVKFTIFDEEFVAGPECVVKVPKLAAFSITAMTDAVMYDVGGLPRWYAYLQDRASVLEYDPARAKNPAAFEALREKFDVQLKMK